MSSGPYLSFYNQRESLKKRELICITEKALFLFLMKEVIILLIL